ncbi:GDP-mannose 4,6-dehydratase [Lentilitoribacter sp. Alg239-R112]|uniref:GDP-mannose 4,6-dehydratase n=1 Tax=Lentilitoribacter sp. Alg239-R112 TaxID=2305987 RepID=UPI0013A6F310|nr:GDP-mannose 4,6-dehydratase [Lentilitoribacter sp. Alg239-R112]
MEIKPKQRALVLGANGQDGSYLCEHLVAANFDVIGIGRQEVAAHPILSSAYEYRQIDLCDYELVVMFLKKIKPDIVYHVAAVHGSAGFEYETVFDKVIDVNLKSLFAILEYARNHNTQTRCVYASSAKIFTSPLAGEIRENYPQSQDCLYSITKIAAESILDYYYTRHGIVGHVAYFFNHESARRGSEFFFSKICDSVAHSVIDVNYQVEVQNLNFDLDWGSAEEFMHYFMRLATKSEPEKVIISRGETLNAKTLTASLFAHYGLDFCDHIIINSPSPKLTSFNTNLEHMEQIFGGLPKVTAFDLGVSMVEEKLKSLRAVI